VVGTEKFYRITQVDALSVGEILPHSPPSMSPRQRQSGIPGDSTQSKDGALISQQSPFSIEERCAGESLGRQRIIPWRGAADGGADVTVPQREAIIPSGAAGLAGEARAMESGEEKIAAAVAGEDAAGAVGAMGAGCKADDPEGRIRIAEARDGFTPIFESGVGAALLAGDVFTIGSQTRAAGAGSDEVAEFRERRG